MTWLSPAKAAETGRWPLGRDAIRLRCDKYRTAVQTGRKPDPDAIKCIRNGRGYQIEEADLDAWLKRQTT